jgi:hypothetical protein
MNHWQGRLPTIPSASIALSQLPMATHTNPVSSRWRRTILLALSMAGLAACATPMLYKDHQPLRGRVTKVWTEQEMREDWQANLQGLGVVPPIGTYVSEYRKVTVYLGHIWRSRIFEPVLSRSPLALGEGDVVEIDIGMRSQAPIDFGDVAIVTKVTCRASEQMCIDDRHVGALLGPVRK